MNKEILASKILAGGDVATQSASERVVELVLNTIKDAVKKGDRVSLAGFGIIQSKQVKAKTGRNPRTGQPMKIVAHKKVKFTVAKKFKLHINTAKKNK